MRWSRYRIGWRAIITAVVFLFAFLQGFSTIVGPWAAYFFAPKSSDGLNPKLVGMWHEKFQYPEPNGVASFEGTIEYFRNKTYRINGLLKSTVFAPSSSTSETTSYRFDGNGEWQATDDELEIKLLDVQVRVANKSPTNMSVVRGPSPSAEESAIERGLLLAKSQRYDIRSAKKDEVVLETGGLLADSFVIKMNRTKQMYMR
jgi:hypothetical protein